MNTEAINTISSLIPVLTSLISEVVSLTSKLQDEGYEVPAIDDLKAINDKLRALEDL